MPVIEMKVPSPGESITEVQISRWIKQDGDFVEKDEEICEIDSDKATLTLNAEADGKLSIKVKAGETIAVGTLVATINTDEAAPKKETPAPAPEKKAEKSSAPEPKPISSGIASPAAQKMMTEKGISATQIEATGKGGRITKGDALKSISSPKQGEVIPTKNNEAAKQEPKGGRAERREKMSMLRRKISERLVAVKQETAMLTTFNEVDMSAIIRLRKQYKEKFKETHGVNLGFMSFFIKAVCNALEVFPMVNARLDGEALVFHEYADIGIAVSAPKGLMVPVIRNAESMGLAELEQQVLALAGKARENKLSIEEMSGGTFTITNGGVFGSMLSTPILNPPQSAILGMHNIVERPVAIDGKVEVRPVMYVALSYDHRLIDGKESVSFLVKVKEQLEAPVKMLFNGNDPERTLLGI